MPLFFAFDDRHQIPDDVLKMLMTRANTVARLDKDGYIYIKDAYLNREDGYIEQEKQTYVDLALRIAKFIGADPNDPTCRGMICTCPTECDCQDYENGFVSNMCPIHNKNPDYNDECPQHGENWIG